MGKKGESIHVRVGEEIKNQIQERVDKGEYDDITDFIRKAIKNELMKDSEEERISKLLKELIRNDPDVRDLIRS